MTLREGQVALALNFATNLDRFAENRTGVHRGWGKIK
jgi:hypothetical protein